LVGDLADEVAVLYAGQIVEHGPTTEVLASPFHPYTRALIGSVPQIGAEADRLVAIPGNVPLPGAFPRACRFHPRCPQAQPDCAVQAPALETVAPQRRVRCPYWQATNRLARPTPTTRPLAGPTHKT
jgi:oligopeptide/dipeptide ABC transporter ATP-binding protein